MADPELEYRWPRALILGAAILGVDCLGAVNPLPLEDALEVIDLGFEIPWARGATFGLAMCGVDVYGDTDVGPALEADWPSGGVVLEPEWPLGAVYGLAVFGVDLFGVSDVCPLEPPWSS